MQYMLTNLKTNEILAFATKEGRDKYIQRKGGSYKLWEKEYTDEEINEMIAGN